MSGCQVKWTPEQLHWYQGLSYLSILAKCYLIFSRVEPRSTSLMALVQRGLWQWQGPAPPSLRRSPSSAPSLRRISRRWWRPQGPPSRQSPWDWLCPPPSAALWSGREEQRSGKSGRSQEPVFRSATNMYLSCDATLKSRLRVRCSQIVQRGQ